MWVVARGSCITCVMYMNIFTKPLTKPQTSPCAVVLCWLGNMLKISDKSFPNTLLKLK